MDLANTLDAWNSLSGGNGVSTYNMPSADDIFNSSITDSSGFSLSGLQLPGFMKLGSSVLGAYGDILQGQEQAGAYEYNAQLALDQGEIRNEQLGIEEESILSTQKAMYAKAGVTMSGSPVDVAFNTAHAVEMDKQINKYNAESRANMSRYEAEVAKSQSKIKAGSSLISGATSLLPLLLL